MDPVLSLRNKINVPANDSVSIYILGAFGRSEEQIQEIISHYNNEKTLDKEFEISTLMNVINTKNMGIDGENMRTYNIMLNYLYQTTKLSVDEERMDLLRKKCFRTIWTMEIWS